MTLKVSYFQKIVYPISKLSIIAPNYVSYLQICVYNWLMKTIIEVKSILSHSNLVYNLNTNNIQKELVSYPATFLKNKSKTVFPIYLEN